MFGPSPCLRHYPKRWATMASADFCLITTVIAESGAAVFFVGCYPVSCSLLLKDDSCQSGQAVGHPVRPVRDLRQSYRCMSDRYPRIRQHTFAAQLRHLPYPLDQGFRYLVLTYPRTRPFMAFLFVSSLLCYRLPSDIVSRLCPCLSLIVSQSLIDRVIHR